MIDSKHHFVTKFPTDNFRKILQSNQDVKLLTIKPIEQYQKLNIDWIYKSIALLHQYLYNQPNSPRTIQVIDVIAQTCEHPIIVLIEVYLLIPLCNIASSHNDASLRAIEFIRFFAHVKPRRTVQNEEIKQDSNFTKALIELKKQQIDLNAKYQFYKQEQLNSIRHKFLYKLQLFTDKYENYSEYFTIALLKTIRQEDIKQQLDLKPLLQYSDSYINLAILTYIQSQMNQIQIDFHLKGKIIEVLNDFIEQGDIEAILLVNTTDFIIKIGKRIGEVNGNLGLQEGVNIYPEIEVSSYVKQQFYLLFLKCIENWAICIPLSEEDKNKNSKAVYQFLKNQRKFVFPQNKMLNKIKIKIQNNLKTKIQRIQKLVQLSDQGFSNLVNSVDSKSNKKSSWINKNDELPLRIKNVESNLQLLCQNPSTLKLKIDQLQNFKTFWQKYAAEISFQRQDSNIIDSALTLLQKVQSAIENFKSLKKSEISYEQFCNRINKIKINSFVVSEPNRISQKLIFQNIRLDNMRLKPKRISQSYQELNRLYYSAVLEDRSVIQNSIVMDPREVKNQSQELKGEDLNGFVDSKPTAKFGSVRQRSTDSKDFGSNFKKTPSAIIEQTYSEMNTENEIDKIKKPECDPLDESAPNTEIFKKQFKDCILSPNQCKQAVKNIQYMLDSDGKFRNFIKFSQQTNSKRSVLVNYINKDKLSKVRIQGSNQSWEQISQQTKQINLKIQSKNQNEGQSYSIENMKDKILFTNSIFNPQSSLRNSDLNGLVSACKFEQQRYTLTLMQHDQACLPIHQIDVNQRILKQLLKFKCILQRNDEIQMGYICKKNDDFLEIVLFLSPGQNDLIDVNYTFSQQNNLSIKKYPNNLDYIPIGTQHKIHLFIHINNTPFLLPQMILQYCIKGKQNFIRKQQFYVPISINQFFTSHEIAAYNFSIRFAQCSQGLKTQPFQYNYRLMNTQRMKKYFPNIIQLQRQSEAKTYGLQMYFNKSRYLLRLSVMGKKSAMWQGVIEEGNRRLLQFLMCTLQKLMSNSE